MADLKLTADFTDLQTLKRELLDIPKKARDSARTFEAEFARAERILVKQARQFERNAQESQRFYSELLKLNKVTKDAGGSAQVFVRELEKQERELDRLKTKYDPLYASSQLYERSLNEINLAHEKGAISAQRQIQLIDQLNAEYQAFAAGSTAATNRFVTAQAASSRGMNAMGVGMQQAGYQVGDFLVQVQSGTNWMVAFGQQATQLVGILPMFNSVMGISGTALVALSAGLGIAIPLLTAIGAAFLRTRQEADASADSIDDLEGRLKSLDGTLKDWLRTLRAAERGVTVEELLGLEGLENAEQLVERAAEALAAAQEKLQSAGSGLGIVGGGVGFAVGAGRRAEADVAAAEKEFAAATERLATLRRKQASERIALVREEREILRDQISLTQEALRYGEDSVQYRQLEVEQTLRAYAADLKRKNVGPEAIASLVEQYRLSLELSDQLDNSKDSASGLADALRDAASAMSALTDFSAGLDRALAVAAAKVGALREGANAAVAGQIAGMRVDLERRMNEAVGAGVDRGIVERVFGGERGRISQLAALEEERVSLQESQRRGGDRSSKEQENYLLNLQKEAELKLQMIGLSEQEQRRLELVHELTTRNLPVEDERIQKLIATEAALRQAMEAEERREQLMNSIKGNLEAGFMAMIDGSKSVEDAFKSMIRAILVDIAQQAIVKPIASGITSFLFPGRASGGSMMAGKPYLVGESGPELVIPSRGSTVANANLTGDAMGGGQAVVINQTFQFSANGDDSVKRIIAAEAPKIAALTQKQIVDQRRRGGQMRSVFG